MDLLMLAAAGGVELFSVQNGVALLTLTLLEVVLGIDNVVFIAILAQRLEASKQKLAIRVGLAAAMLARIVLLFLATWLMSLEETKLFTIPWFGPDTPISVKDLVLMIGGGFLVANDPGRR